MDSVETGVMTYYGTKRIKAIPAEKDGQAGYTVWYEPDGYKSWSPKDVFEAAYKCSGEMNFGHALEALKRGLRVFRSGWNGKGQWLAMQRPDQHSKMTEPYIYMKTAQGGFIPWLASQADVLAGDWGVGIGVAEEGETE